MKLTTKLYLTHQHMRPATAGRMQPSRAFSRARSLRKSILMLMVAFFGVFAIVPALIGRAQNETPVTTVSAASFDPTKAVAPNSIVTAFGTMLATQFVQAGTNPLPTILGGTTVEVNQRKAGLFYVSPGQINFVIPGQTEVGRADVNVRSGDGTISHGTVEVAAVAPSVFTASSTGSGVPAGSFLRGQPNNWSEGPLSKPDGTVMPLDLGSVGDVVFVTFFLTGIRGAADIDLNRDGNFNESVRVAIDGESLVPSYAGEQGYYVGLDQINVEIPRTLLGRGKASLTVFATGYTGAAKITDLEFAGTPSPARPRISSFTPVMLLAGDVLTIKGTGFSPTLGGNTVNLLDQDGLSTVAPVMSASVSELKVRVPFGTGSGRVKVTTGAPDTLTGLSTDELSLITSISGFVQDDRRQPIPGATIKVILGNQSIQTLSKDEGSFTLANVPPTTPPSGFRLVSLDAGIITGGLPTSAEPRRQPVLANRDNLMPSPIELKGVFNPPSPFSGIMEGIDGTADVTRTTAVISQSTGVTLDVPGNAVVQYPAGTAGPLTVGVFAAGRTPANLPVGYFSSSIVQITPFGATIAPGAQLTLPNSDQLPAGSQAILFSFDRTGSGSFVQAGVATVSADGQRVVTAVNAVKEATYYFVATLRPTATLMGTVVDSDGKPLRLAIIQGRGQSTFTDALGSFVLRGIPVMTTNDKVNLDVSFLRADGRVERSQLTNFPLIAGGVNQATMPVTLPASSTNRPPTIFAPLSISANQGATSNFSFVASDPDTGQTLQVAVSGAAFASIIPGTKPAYVLRVAPAANVSGSFPLTLTATDSLGLVTSQVIALKVNRAPTASAQSVSTATGVVKAITLTGSDADGDAITYAIVTNPAHGILSGAPPNVIYTPAANYSGPDSFTFKVNDGLADSVAATVTVTVNSPVPTLASLNPTTVIAGATGFPLTVNGTGFVSSSVVRVNGAARTTTFVSATRLTADVLTSDLVSAGAVSVTVLNAAPGGGISGAVNLAVNNPLPAASNLQPAVIAAGGSTFTLTVNGSNFVSTSVVQWNNASRSTSFVNSGRLTAQIPAGDIALAGTATINVLNLAPGGGTSNGLTFTINNPLPSVSNVSPATVNRGGSGFTLTVNGSGFVSSSVVRWNSAERNTTFINAGQLMAQIPDADIILPGTVEVSVSSPGPGGGISNSVTFQITNPAPVANNLEPASVTAGSSAFTLRVFGSGFVPGSIVRWDNGDRVTTFVNAGHLSTQIPANLVVSAGFVTVTVFSPGPGGGTSAGLTFSITNPIPTIANLNPPQAAAGGPAFVLTVNGSGFVPGSVVRWNGASRTTTFLSSGQLTAQIPAGDIASTGTAVITVSNASPGGGVSNSVNFPIITCPDCN